MTINASFEFHILGTHDAVARVTPWTLLSGSTYDLANHFHPYTGELIALLNRQSVSGLLDVDEHAKLVDTEFFENEYGAPSTEAPVIVKPTEKNIDVELQGPYAIYNWELLFHVPLRIAVHLSKSQRFAEAQKWFHFIFNPTIEFSENESDLKGHPCWRFLGFRKDRKVRQIDELLAILSKPESQCNKEEKEERELIRSGYNTLLENPFQPHVVARTRLIAYQYSVVMKYLDNLVAWGDSLFRQDTMETINEAMMLYVLAACVLGPKPQQVPNRGTSRPRTFAEMRKSKTDPLGNLLVELEARFPFAIYNVAGGTADQGKAKALFGIGETLYFCMPRHDGLLRYWDLVADRLFKIRHCMNIEGVVRQLPLFQPPIDPGMLVKAAAAGIDIGSLVSGMNKPLAPVRSAFLVQKALELCGEVRSMGDKLLSAIEKKSAEELSLLRQEHEIKIQQLSQDVRFLQWKSAESATDALLESRKTAVDRFLHYLRLIGVKEEDAGIEKTLAVTREALTEENFDEMFGQLVGQYAIELELNDYGTLEMKDSELYLNQSEDVELNHHLPTSRDTNLAASIVEMVGSAVAFIPDAKGNLHFWGMGGTIDVPIGTAITKSIEIAARILRTTAAWHRDQAGMASRKAGHQRRADEWIFQSNQAARELMHMGRQIITSLIQEQIARHEYEIQKTRIEQAQETDDFLRGKFTNHELYGWMQGELSKLFYEYYKFAFDIARQAELTMKHELMRPEFNDKDFVKFNYWDGGRKGLLSGEALYLDLKRLEMAYHEHNRREFELTKSVSVMQLDPLALLQLRATGSCEVDVPEEVFDLDCPGHYMRRIKSIGLSIPSVVGPHTSINCMLSLLRSKIRKDPLLTDGAYQETPDGEDPRFVYYYGTIQSVVTSNASNDSGMFETNLRDERVLPFENAGAISRWKLDLPAEFRQFDYDTISDVILHIRYTARAGIPAGAVEEHLKTLLGGESGCLYRLLSLKHDFPTQWSAFTAGKPDTQLKITIDRKHFPFIVEGRKIAVKDCTLFADDKGTIISADAKLDLNVLANGLNDENIHSYEVALTKNSVLEQDKPATNGKKKDAREAFLLLTYSIEEK